MRCDMECMLYEAQSEEENHSPPNHVQAKAQFVGPIEYDPASTCRHETGSGEVAVVVGTDGDTVENHDGAKENNGQECLWGESSDGGGYKLITGEESREECVSAPDDTC
mmetsp:Transcript_35196/g.42393  ORF Transcript_35196/g.42393 Transcript_35196/m.42393 type:complete len:109 (+) Transcript_35196:150-476(+)